MRYPSEEVIVFLILALAAVSQGAVLRSPTIDNPCQVAPASTGTRVYLPINEQIQLTITAANMADIVSQQFKHSLRSVLTLRETNILDSPENNVPDLPLAHGDPVVAASNNVSTLKQDYRDISTYIVYLQFFKNLHITRDSGTFADGIDLVTNRFYSWLCCIDTILRSQRNPMTQFVGDSAVNEDVETYATNGDTKSRYSLYYVTMKNAHDFIQNKNRKWLSYLRTVS